MSFLQGLIWFAFKFICLAAIAVAGVVCGKKLRDKKDAKNQQ